jgi:hypothetical protein
MGVARGAAVAAAHGLTMSALWAFRGTAAPERKSCNREGEAAPQQTPCRPANRRLFMK